MRIAPCWIWSWRCFEWFFCTKFMVNIFARYHVNPYIGDMINGAWYPPPYQMYKGGGLPYVRKMGLYIYTPGFLLVCIMCIHHNIIIITLIWCVTVIWPKRICLCDYTFPTSSKAPMAHRWAVGISGDFNATKKTPHSILKDELNGWWLLRFIENLEPIGSMWLVYLPTWKPKNKPHVGRYTLHGWYGEWQKNKKQLNGWWLTRMWFFDEIWNISSVEFQVRQKSHLPIISIFVGGSRAVGFQARHVA